MQQVSPHKINNEQMMYLWN
uniref:Uncharacterized protein n=1 Tax=Arundo donax TaxID=35708 RepID=A0A0A9HFT7_ARUDO